MPRKSKDGPNVPTRKQLERWVEAATSGDTSRPMLCFRFVSDLSSVGGPLESWKRALVATDGYRLHALKVEDDHPLGYQVPNMEMAPPEIVPVLGSRYDQREMLCMIPDPESVRTLRQIGGDWCAHLLREHPARHTEAVGPHLDLQWRKRNTHRGLVNVSMSSVKLRGEVAQMAAMYLGDAIPQGEGRVMRVLPDANNLEFGPVMVVPEDEALEYFAIIMPTRAGQA